MTLTSHLRYTIQTVGDPVPVVVTNLPHSSPSWVENLSTVSGFVSLIVSGVAAVIAYQALRWSKNSWKKEGPLLKAELQLVQKLVPSPGEIKVDKKIQDFLPTNMTPTPFKIHPELEVVISNGGRTSAQVHNMAITFWDEATKSEVPWYVGLHLNVPAHGTATKKFDTQKLSSFLHLAQLKQISAVYGVIDGSAEDEATGIRAELSRADVEVLNSSFPSHR